MSWSTIYTKVFISTDTVAEMAQTGELHHHVTAENDYKDNGMESG